MQQTHPGAAEAAGWRWQAAVQCGCSRLCATQQAGEVTVVPPRHGRLSGLLVAPTELALVIASWQTCAELLLAGLLTVLLRPLSATDGLLKEM